MGHAKAQTALGCLYANGLGMNKNIEQALLWFESSDNLGFQGASYNKIINIFSGIYIDRPQIDILNKVTDTLKEWRNKTMGYWQLFTYGALIYNIGIYLRRGSQCNDDVISWLEAANEKGWGFYNEYLTYYEEEEKKRKREEKVVKGLGMIANVLGKINDFDDKGGVF